MSVQQTYARRAADDLDQAARERGGGRFGAPADLLEREAELAAVAALLHSACAGTGGALMIEAHAGMGKTRVHDAAVELARRHGMPVFRGAGAELERSIGFGATAQILHSLISELAGREREELIAAAPRRVRSLAGLAHVAEADLSGSELTLSHGLFAMLAGACAGGPALLALEDLHWFDGPSLAFVLYLLHRLDELSLAVLLTRRPAVGEPASAELDHICAHPRVRVHALAPFGRDAVDQLVRAALDGGADGALVDVCHEITAGNPFYLRELLLALAETPEAGTQQLARRARTLAPDAVTRALRVRVGRLGPVAAGLARAVAILGEDTPLRLAAALAGLGNHEASVAADALAQVEILRGREPLRFVHPLVRQAIQADIPASERSSRHLEAARLLYADGAEAERVAAHLLRGRGEGDSWAVDQLRAAARTALARSAPASSVRYLERALAEPPARELRPPLLGELGAAEAAAGAPAAAEHLLAALAATPDPRRRAELSLTLGRALHAQGQHRQAAGAFEAGLAELTEPVGGDALAVHDALQAGFVAAASLVPSLHGASVAGSADLLERARQAAHDRRRRLLLAQAAVSAGLRGEPASIVLDRCDQAWDGGRLLEDEGAEGIGWSLVATGLCLSGEFERCLEITDAVLEHARVQALPLAYATASYLRALPRLYQGRVSDAVAEVERAREARLRGWKQFLRAASAVYGLCFLEAGDVWLAELAVTDDGPLDEPRDLEDVYRLCALAQIQLAGGRPQDALQSALRAGSALEGTAQLMAGCAPWRDTAAEACHALGRPRRALELAHEAHELARSGGVVHERIRALRVLGLCESGKRAFALLREACELGESAPPRLETIRAQIEFGAALRRSNRRSAAREPLGRAADAAAQYGARALYERARTELAATGARPRRELLLSGAGSLTASERRIAERAAAGQSNRQIAQALFVTPKTVEYHLRNAYRKLDIEGRGQLADALAD